MFAVVKGQPIPLFQGAQPEAQVRAVLTELLRVAAANGVTGRRGRPTEKRRRGSRRRAGRGAAPAAAPGGLRRDRRRRLRAAIVAYEQALRESPADDDARIGLAQVRLLQRTADADLDAARAAAAANPEDVDAQILVADIDLLGGHVEDAFIRLVDTVRRTSGADRERARTHLVELFEVVGQGDPRVPAARLALANAVFA